MRGGVARGWAWVALATLGGFAVRAWDLDRIGAHHFDEGIYTAIAWGAEGPSEAYRGDPAGVAYAPAGYPALAWLASRGLGGFGTTGGDLGPFLISIAAGCAAIAIAGGLAMRWGGAVAGALAAGWLAFSGPQIAFSRMALVDATALAATLGAAWAAAAWLDRPTVSRALALGLAVGGAMWVKYNGWMGGLVAALAAGGAWLSGVRVRIGRGEGLSGTRALGGLALAACAALLVYAPWVGFVESVSEGGYRGLLRHQSGYFDGFGAWPRNAGLQIRQSRALGGGWAWGMVAGVWTAAVIGWSGGGGWRRWVGGLAVGAGVALVPRLAPELALAGAAVVGALWAWSGGERDGRFVVPAAVWVWGALTPLYHPYARLGLPTEAFAALAWSAAIGRWVEGEWGWKWSGEKGKGKWALAAVAGSALALALAGILRWAAPGGETRAANPGFATDATRGQTKALVEAMGPGRSAVRVYARPGVLADLARAGVSAARAGSLDDALEGGPGGGGGFLIVDEALIGQEGDPAEARRRLFARWEEVAAARAELPPPAMLDLDPVAVFGANPDSGTLRLLRRRGGD